VNSVSLNASLMIAGVNIVAEMSQTQGQWIHIEFVLYRASVLASDLVMYRSVLWEIGPRIVPGDTGTSNCVSNRCGYARE
jgi:hypothetical protein